MRGPGFGGRVVVDSCIVQPPFRVDATAPYGAIPAFIQGAGDRAMLFAYLPCAFCLLPGAFRRGGARRNALRGYGAGSRTAVGFPLPWGKGTPRIAQDRRSRR